MEGPCSDTDKLVLLKVKFGVFLRNGGVEAWQRGAAWCLGWDQLSSTKQPKRARPPQLPAEEPPSTFPAANKRGPPHSPRGHRIPASPPARTAPGCGANPHGARAAGPEHLCPAARGNSAARRRREVQQGPQRGSRSRGRPAAQGGEPGQGASGRATGSCPPGPMENGKKTQPL